MNEVFHCNPETADLMGLVITQPPLFQDTQGTFDFGDDSPCLYATRPIVKGKGERHD